MININALIEEGAPEDVILDAVRKNREEQAMIEEAKRQAEELKKAESAQKSQMQYRAEGRAHLINAILAYDDAFNIFGPDPLDEDDIKDLEEAIVMMEELIPLYAKMLDVEKKFKDGEFGSFGLGGR